MSQKFTPLDRWLQRKSQPPHPQGNLTAGSTENRNEIPTADDSLAVPLQRAADKSLKRDRPTLLKTRKEKCKLDRWLLRKSSPSRPQEIETARSIKTGSEIPMEASRPAEPLQKAADAENGSGEDRPISKKGRNRKYKLDRRPQGGMSPPHFQDNVTAGPSAAINEIPMEDDRPDEPLQKPVDAEIGLGEDHPISKKARKRKYKFNEDWLTTFKWARLDSSKKIICHTCVEAKKFGLFPFDFYVRENFISIGFSRWKEAEESLQQHENSRQHGMAVSKLGCLSRPSSSISSQAVKLQEFARVALRAIFTSLQYLGMQGLAIQGHNNDDGNFRRLISLRSQDIPELQDWLKRNRSFTSSKIQNEILRYIGLGIQRKLIEEIKQCEEYSIIADESSDISGKEQLAFCIRAVNSDLTPKEYFLGLYKVESTTAESIFTVINDILLRFGLDINKIRAHCYDGASNMSGVHRGVAAKIVQVEPRAIYNHCFAHCLNLAVQDSVKSVQMLRNTMDVVHELSVVVKGSPKRISQFENLCASNEGNSKIKPQPLCPFRFLLRVRSFRAVKENYNILMELMEEIGETNEKIAPKASGIFHQLCKFETYFSVILCIELFSYIESLSRAVQRPCATKTFK